jgi:predicted phage baseplate assembly protein
MSVSYPVPSEIRIPAGTRFTLIGPDENSVYYEVYRAPNDFVSPISIPPNKRGVIAYGIEGYTESPVVRTSNGELNQFIEINDAKVLDEPITVEVSSGSTSVFWRRVDVIEKSSSNDEVFEVRHSDGKSTIIFGDNVAGSAPLSGQTITVMYRVGGGSRGRISSGVINETRSMVPQPPYTAAVEVTFRNLVSSSGGVDEETVEQAKKRAPREFATHDNAVTGEDYSLLASEYSHPVYGSVAKAVAVLRTGVSSDTEIVAAQIRAATSDEEAANILQSNFVNRNLVEFYVLADGPNDTPVLPNSGLKQGLISYFNDINVLTDEIMVLDGAIKPVDVSATVVISRSADAGTTKVAVESAINDFFSLRNFDMGTELFVAHLYAMIQGVAGVKFVDIFEPADDIIKSYKKAEVGSAFIGYNEVITLGNVDLKFYYEPGNFKIPPVR